MPAGLQITNPSGTIQIDENYANLAIIEKRTVSAAQGGAYDSALKVDVTVTSDFPFIAIKCARPCAITKIQRAGTSSTAIYTISVAPSGNPPWASFPVDVYVFGRTKQFADGVGLQVFDSTGKITYDSNNAYADIVGMITSTTFPMNQADYVYGTSANSYACVFGNIIGYTESQQVDLGTGFHTDYKERSTATVQSIAGGIRTAAMSYYLEVVAGIPGDPDPFGTYKYTMSAGQILVCDVTLADVIL